MADQIGIAVGNKFFWFPRYLLWWGLLLVAVGGMYSWKFRPRK